MSYPIPGSWSRIRAGRLSDESSFYKIFATEFINHDLS
jgi:hypothetical protein